MRPRLLATGRFAFAFAALGLIAAVSACSKETPVGGLVVDLHTDGTLMPEPDTLSIQVGSIDGGVAYREATYPMTDASAGGAATYAWPVSFAVESNGDPRASVGFVVSTESSAGIETQRYEVDSIPTDTFVRLDVVFSAACAGTSDGLATGGCCIAPCAWSGTACVCDARMLAPVASKGSLPDLSLPDANGTSDSTDGAEGSCDAGDVQCLDLTTPEQCGQDGQWHSGAPCAAPIQYCFEGSCIPSPTSCEAPYDKCESYLVPGGSYLRGGDPLHADAGAPATVSTFRLDAWEVTAGRFQAFVNAVRLGEALPVANAGTHSYLPAGGLNGGGSGTTYESGWDPTWTTAAMFPSDGDTWDTRLNCSTAPTYEDYSLNAALPINCVTWYEAYAFCIWDGGFLPSEAEWNEAAADGNEQRLYPWGSEDPALGMRAYYGCLYPTEFTCTEPRLENISNTGFAGGRGAFGQWNLAGNLSEWTFDYYASAYPTPCDDCASLVPSSQRVVRGGGFDQVESFLYTSSRVPTDPATRAPDLGIRCARAP